MGNAVKRLPSETERDGIDRRPQTRKVARRPAHCRVTIVGSTGRDVQVQLSDLSTHGCSVRGQVSSLRSGSFIAMQIASGKPIQAIVRWVREDLAGIEFLRPVCGEHPDWLAQVRESEGW